MDTYFVRSMNGKINLKIHLGWIDKNIQDE